MPDSDQTKPHEITDVQELADRIAPILYQYFVRDCISDNTVPMTDKAARALAPILLAAARAPLPSI